MTYKGIFLIRKGNLPINFPHKFSLLHSLPRQKEFIKEEGMGKVRKVWKKDS
jgi:hypothetical protein